MPITVSQLMKYAEEHPDDPPPDYRSLVAGLAAPAMQQIQVTVGTLYAQQVRDTLSTLSKSTLSNGGSNAVLTATGERIRGEAEARQAVIDARNLAMQQTLDIQQLRAESDASQRKYFRKSVAITVLVTAVFTALPFIIAWLLTR